MTLVDNEAIIIAIEIKHKLGIALASNEAKVVPGPELIIRTGLALPDMQLMTILVPKLINLVLYS